MENITWLSNWYMANCNGEWELHYGVKIDTLDNPGWWFRADLVDTEHQGKKLEVKESVSEADWYVIKCNGKTFEAYGDVSKLNLLIELFKNFVEEDITFNYLNFLL